MKVGDFLLSKTGEAFRVLKLDDKTIEMVLHETGYVICGPASNLSGLMADTGMKQIAEDEYKHRVVAMRMFQDCKHDKSYEHKTYLGQYEEMKYMSKETVDSFFDLGGGWANHVKGDEDGEF